VRKGDWKLHQYFEDGAFELYNLSEDIGEKNDLSASETEKLQELKKVLEDWRKATNAPVPGKAEGKRG